MTEYLYQTLQVENRMPFSGGPTQMGQSIGAGVKLLQKGMIALNEFSVSWRVNDEIRKIAPTIAKRMPAGGGVLLCVGIQEWERADPAGAKAKSFLSLHIVDAGHEPYPILTRYLNSARLDQGAPKGWTRKDYFVWVTAARS